MPGPLDDVTVLDLTHHIVGPYATKLLADYGANVVKVERLDGDPARRLPPFKDDDPHPEKSGTFFYFNTNKRSIAVDLQHPQAPAVLGPLIDRSDVVVESFRPGVLERLGVGWEFIHARKPSLPLLSISNFGRSGPYRDYKGSDLVLYAYAGEMHSMGVLEREPVKLYGTAALVQTGAAATTAILGALFVGHDAGIGQHVDFAIADSHFGGVDRRHASVIAHEFAGRKTLRRPRGTAQILAGVYPCADGYVEFSRAALRLDRVREMLGDPDWLQGAKWDAPGADSDTALAEEFDAHFYAWLSTRTKHEIWDAARRTKVLCGPLFTAADLFQDKHFHTRGFWERVDSPTLGQFALPGRPFIMHDSPWALRRLAPRLGEHTREVLGDAGFSTREVERLIAARVVQVGNDGATA